MFMPKEQRLSELSYTSRDLAEYLEVTPDLLPHALKLVNGTNAELRAQKSQNVGSVVVETTAEQILVN